MFKERTAIIAGGGGGIGRALAVALARRGAEVWLADVDEEGMHTTVREVERVGGRVEWARVDVSKSEEVEAYVDRVAALRGGLDFMFNNVGVVTMGEFWAFDEAEWRRLFEIDLMGVVHGTQAAYRVMRRRGRGHIVNTSSMTGLTPAPLLAPYAAMKHGVVGLSLSLRAEVRPKGVRVSVVCPGYVKTAMLKMQEPHHRMLHDGAEPQIGDRSRVRSMTPERVAEQALAGVKRNRAVIVPGMVWRMRWRIGRCAPWLVDRWASTVYLRARGSLEREGFSFEEPDQG